MRTKLITTFFIIGLIIFISSQFLSAIDAPHNEGNNVSCGSCHGQTVLDSSPFWGGTSSYDQLCLKCHIALSGEEYSDISAPLVKTHSSANTDNRYGDWSRQCVNCHDPHYQLQKNFKNTDAGNLYLAKGTIISFDPYDVGNNTTTLHYSSITYKTQTGWNATKLTEKTGPYRGAILFPNVNKLGYSYSVTAINSGEGTITVKGDASPVYQYISSSNFAIIYGQYIKDYIDTSVLWGVVNIDTGNSLDGAITINTVKNINTDIIAGGRSYPDGVNWQITNNVPFGQATISSGTSRPDGFAVGDEIMIINLKGTSTNYSNVGLYEFKTITAIPDSTSITVDSNLTNSYDGTTQKIMVQRVPHYTEVTINTGGSLTCNAFDGNKGGVVVFRASGTVTVNAADGITAINKGFIGGTGGAGIGGGNGGETYNGAGGTGASGGNGFSGQGGGGGSAPASCWVTCTYYSGGAGTIGGGGGGGGGNGGGVACVNANSSASGAGGGSGVYGNSGSTTGADGGGNGNGPGAGGKGGNYGITNLSSSLYLGSGGGGGGGARCNNATATGGSGGSGGGIIYIAANNVTINSEGIVSADGGSGAAGASVSYYGGDIHGIMGWFYANGGTGGAGAGGSVAVLAGQINNSGSISANGGSGASGGRTYAAFTSFSGNNPAPNYSSSTGRVISPGSTPFSAQVKFFDQTGINSFADGQSTYRLSDGYTTYNGICELCHRQPTHFRNDGSAPDQNHTDLSFLGNSIPGTNCISCHSHDGGFKPTESCLGCHSMSINNRANIAAQFSGNSHHVQGVIATGVDCYQCHWEANSDGTMNILYHGGTSGSVVDLVVYTSGGAYQIGTRPTTYTVGTTAIQYTANGTRTEFKKLNTHCLGCHSDGNSGTRPFSDGKLTTEYAWDGRSIGEKYSQTGTTPWGKYSGGNFTPKNTRTKAYSAHGNATANQGGWNLSETWPNTRAGSENVICFDCHNSHGSNVNGITTSYTSATTNGGILKDIISGKGGYSITYKPQAGGSTTNHNAYNAGAGLCFDCHLNANAGANPWGYSSTFGATQAITGYWDTPYFGPGTAPYQQRFSFRSSNSMQGGHFGASFPLSSTPSHTINGLCTPCHDPHGVSPTLGANMQYGIPLLKGTWLTSFYKEDWPPQYNVIGTIRTDRGREGVHFHIDQNTFGTDITSSVTGITQTDTEFAGLCLNCHPKNTLTNGTNHAWKSKDRIHESVKGWKTTGTPVEHNYPCSKCHTPHNANLPRLMVTDCLDLRHKGLQANNPAPRINGSGSGYTACGGHVCPMECGTQSCATWPGSGNINCSTELGFCPSVTSAINCGDSTPIPGAYASGHGSGGRLGNWAGGCNITDSHYYDERHNTVTCHKNHDSNHYWNVKTPWTSDNSFTPSLFDEPNIIGTAPTSITLGWNSVTSPDGDPVQYYVEVDDANDFSSPITSGWISGNNWTVSIPTTGTWYWRVQARDANHTSVLSDWSTFDSFSISQTPPAPILIPEPDYSPRPYVLQWADVTGPVLGDPVEYYAQISVWPGFTQYTWSSGWISGTSWSISPDAYPGGWYWRVQARNANHPSAISPWSTTGFFNAN